MQRKGNAADSLTTALRHSTTAVPCASSTLGTVMGVWGTRSVHIHSCNFLLSLCFVSENKVILGGLNLPEILILWLNIKLVNKPW